MSKAKARNPASYIDEVKAATRAVALLKAAGFSKVKARKSGAIKMVDAVARDGNAVTFWIKVGWSTSPFAAIMFGLFPGKEGAEKSDAEFDRFVSGMCARMAQRGITHSLLVHADDFAVAMQIDEVPKAYREQLRRFPDRARNTKSPTMWFYDPRPEANLALTHIVMKRAVPLDLLAGRSQIEATEPVAQRKMAEIELRVAQQVFRARVGDRCGWKCAVTGSALKEVLEAAHLKGKDWRKHNQATDGIMLRVDIHRLWDRGLARFSRGKFWVAKSARDEYAQYHGQAVSQKTGSSRAGRA